MRKRRNIHDIRKELEDVYDECKKPNWDCYDAKPITRETLQTALAFVAMMDEGMYKDIEFGAHPHGYINIEWYKGVDNLCTINVNGNRLTGLRWSE